MSYLYNWWYPTPQQTKDSNETTATSVKAADNTMVRLYLDELKQKLKNDFRAERAECRLDFSNDDQKKVYSKHREQLINAIVHVYETTCASSDTDKKRVELQKARVCKDFEIEIALQTDYLNALVHNKI